MEFQKAEQTNHVFLNREPMDNEGVAVEGERPGMRAATCTGFQLANWNKANEEKKRDSNRYYKGSEVSPFVGLPFFRMYGSGIYLFFAFIWHAIKMFLALSLISLTPTIYNYYEGNAYNNIDSGLNTFVIKTTIGNYHYPSMTDTDADSQSMSHKLINVIMDIMGCVVFMFFYFYWEKRSASICKEIEKDFSLPSENTVELIEFPQQTTVQMVQDFMGRFGRVSEVAIVKNYSEQIELSKEIYEIELEIKDLNISFESLGAKETEKYRKELQKLEEKKKKIEVEMENDDCGNSVPIKFYVSFDSAQEKKSAMNSFLPYQHTFSCCFASPPENMLMNGEKVTITNCQTEPSGIIWENVHVTWSTRWLRFLIQLILIFVIVGGGFCAISLLNILTPTFDSSIDTSGYTWETIQNESNQTIIKVWCVNNIYADTAYESLCTDYWSQYAKSMALKFCISFVIIGFKFIVKLIMIALARFQRYTNHTEQSVTVMTNLLVTYISTTVLITFLMQANVFNVSFKSFLGNLTNDPRLINNLNSLEEYSDLTSSWYQKIGYQIWFNMLIESFIPHLIMPLLHYLKECFNSFRAKDQILHKNMFRRLQAEEFEIEDNYAQILMVIFVGFMFGGGIPSIIPICLLGIATRYVYCKIAFIRFSRIPKSFREALNERALTILKVALIFRGLISLYMYGAPDIFLPEQSSVSDWASNIDFAIVGEVATLFSRILVTWYYTLFVAIFLLVLLLKDTIFSCVVKCCQKNELQALQESDLKKKESEDEAGSDNFEAISQRALTKSYKLEDNPDYIQILAIMKMKRRISKVERESILPEMIPVKKEEQ